MANTFYPTNDAEFALWLSNFVNKANVHQAEIGLTAAEVTDLQTDLTKFNDELATKQQKREEGVAQTELVRVERKSLNKRVGSLNARIKSITALQTNIIEELGLNVDDDTLTKTTPNTPSDLVVTGTSDSINHLKWKRAGNRQGTMFVVESRVGDANNWSIVTAVTNSKFDHKNQTPGSKIQYRVKAKRGESESGYSNVSGVYE